MIGYIISIIIMAESEMVCLKCSLLVLRAVLDPSKKIYFLSNKINGIDVVLSAFFGKQRECRKIIN